MAWELSDDLIDQIESIDAKPGDKSKIGLGQSFEYDAENYPTASKMRGELRGENGEQQTFRLPSNWLRLISIIIEQKVDARFKTRSDFYRHAAVLLAEYLMVTNEAVDQAIGQKIRELRYEEMLVTADVEQSSHQRNVDTWQGTINKALLAQNQSKLNQIKSSLKGLMDATDDDWYRAELRKMFDRI